MKKWLSILETYLISLIGGYLFSKMGFPLPWLLGPVAIVIIWKMAFPLPWLLGPVAIVIIWKMAFKRELFCPSLLKNSGFTILGIYFGLNFTMATLTTVVPYIFPYMLMTSLLVIISIVNSTIISKFIEIDPVTSVFGSIPGGLTEMVAASESLRGNAAMVTILQTVRLLTVVFLVPFLVLHLFSNQDSVLYTANNQIQTGFSLGFLWFSISAFMGWILRNKLPASYVIAPLLTTALMNIVGIGLPYLPQVVVIFAQVSVGMHMGNSISIADLKKGGKYCGIYAFATSFLIVTAFGLGYLMSLVTNLNFSTALLSVAPGGIIEMALTASSVGADPSIVSSLQLIRLLLIITVVPISLKWWFVWKSKKTVAS